MATSENVGSVSDTRLAAATEEIDFTVRNLPSHVDRTRKAPWASFNKTTHTVTKAMFKGVGSQASRA